VELHDVWTGAPALAPQLTAADYRLTLFNVEQAQLDMAVGRILAAEKLQRVRRREAKTTTYDLRPLILGLRTIAPDLTAAPADTALATGRDSAPGEDATPIAGLWLRLRHSQDRGSGRPDEVVAAIADELGFDTYSLGADDGGDANATGDSPAPATGHEPPRRPVLEVLRPVRERLWLADELD
jgi:hypothetical protein